MIYRALPLALLLAACSDDTNIGPDPTGGNGGSTSNSPNTGGNGGHGGEGGTSNTQGLGYENGTRLRARVMHASDGAAQFMGWRDSELDVDCGFTVAADGESRCLPAVFFSTTGIGIYADAGCTVRAYQTVPSCSGAVVPKFVVGSGSCDGKHEAFRVGAAAKALYSGEPGNCDPIATPPDGYYETTLEPAASFVEATESVD
ncbi:MAG: hypothetical protein HOW73_45440 [Polyangiaceae bacterium]|nr:hypothetical protein [Polyangiaceae bacterium]